MNAYLTNLMAAVQGKRVESYADAESSLGTSNGSMGVAAVFLALLGLIPYFLFAYGAGKLSWCLNHSYGWSFLCFLFPGFYYPYYAFLLNPLCNVPMMGGKRR
jgi:hypothetical protein